MQYRAGRDARAAVDDELFGVEQLLRQRRLVLEKTVAGAGDPPRDRIDRLDLAAPPLWGTGVDDRQPGVVEPLEQLRREGDVVSSWTRHELGAFDLLAIRPQRAVPVVEVDHSGFVVAEVAEQPPEACRPARALVVGDDERLWADAGLSGPCGERVGCRERMPAAAVACPRDRSPGRRARPRARGRSDTPPAGDSRRTGTPRAHRTPSPSRA